MNLIRGIADVAVRLDSAGEVIDAVGGNGAAAVIAGASLQQVSNWRRAGRLAPRTILRFRQALDAIGAEAPSTLWRIDEPRAVVRLLEGEAV